MEQTGPKKFLPFAHTSGENYVCMPIKEREFGVVYFFDREVPGVKALTKIASSLSKFLDVLRPFSVDDVELDPNDA
nr:SMI1/KNR4 family protein [Burkholderia lata]